ncbi:FUSC family protein [Klebsiella pneumoniae]|uniref:FUSC family protein n=1 Tax=Enterobacter ludwigii TaxID=299767 RepID=A0AAX3LIM4_9ENTR|nr:FUSC family protein [Enterobacter ludwigii]WCE15988.1 FUSC family protein [Enterobacter ludwigii]
MKIPYDELRILSLVVAVYIIQLLAFCFNIDGGPTAVMSAIVVSQTFVGAQYLKARNRIAGTVLGIIVSFIAVYLFAEKEVYFIAFSLVWLTFMAMMVSLVPTDNSHLFQLGANTYAFVALPLIEDPSLAYFNLMSRSTGVFMGVTILVATSVLLFLKYSNYDIKSNVRVIYQKTFKIRRKVNAESPIEISEIKAYFSDISKMIINKTNARYEYGFGFKSVSAFKTFSLMSMMLFFYTNTLRHSLKIGGHISDNIKNDYLSIIRKALQCRGDMSKFSHEKLTVSSYFPEHKSFLQAVKRGARTFIVTSILLAIWYVSGWSAGHAMVSLGVVYMILLTSFPSPVSGGKDLVYGTLLGMVTGWFYIQFVYSFPYAYSTPALYFLAQLPVLILGGRWLFVGKTFLFGVTFMTTFYYGLQPSNTTVVTYATFMDNCLGAAVGLAITGLGISIIFPENRFIKSKNLINLTLRELIQVLKSKNMDMSAVILEMHDRLRLTSSLDGHTNDDFTVLANLASLYTIIYYVKEHGQGGETLPPLKKQLTLWFKTGHLTIDDQLTSYFERLIREQTGEAQRISMCTYNILQEIEEIYEK